jgi:hypothetical protein
MPEFLTQTFAEGPAVSPAQVLIRLLVALVFGRLVALVYWRTRTPTERSPSFPPTLVLLAVLIAMVTQVIGDSVARAFSLVGALSIVRFRTVVRDTQDTAFVIFAVIVGMAVGGNDLWVAAIGTVVVAVAAVLMRTGRAGGPAALAMLTSFRLRLRTSLGHDLDQAAGQTFDTYLSDRRLVSIGTAKQGMAIEATYDIRLKQDGTADDLVKALNRLDGVQDVELTAPALADDAI